MKGFICFLLGLQLISFGLMGQSQKTKQKYAYGKELLKEEKHWQAVEVFKRLSKSENGTEIYLNSIYFHALSLYKVNKKQEARQLLFLLADKYPTWGSIDEVYYLMAVIDFDWKSPVDALGHLTKIKSEKVKQDAYNLKKAKLSEDTIERLKYLYAKFPDDEAIGKVLLTKLYEVDGGTNMTLLEELQNKYNADKIIKVDNKPKSLYDSYNVAVLLPYNEKKISSLPHTNFILDLHEGIKLGLEHLEAQGAKLNLYTFDTKRDSATTAQLLANPDMKSMDLIIGPLYGNTLPLAQAFALENHIPFVNPISENSLIIKDNPYGFLLSAGFETLAKGVANYTADNFKKKQAVIIHGTSARDTLAAQAFQKQFELKGGSIFETIEFTEGEYAYNHLVEDLAPLKLDTSKYFVYIASNDMILGGTAFSALQNLLYEGPILAPSRWIDATQMSYTVLEEANVHFVCPMYYNEEKEAAIKFRSAYLDKVKVLPTKYAFMGYETITYFGSLLHQYGLDFPQVMHTDKNNVTSTLFNQLNYQGGNDNQQVDILQFENGTLKIVNKKDGIVDKY